MDPGGSSLRKPITISEYSAVTGAGLVVMTCDIGPQLPPGVVAVPLKVRAGQNRD